MTNPTALPTDPQPFRALFTDPAHADIITGFLNDFAGLHLKTSDIVILNPLSASDSDSTGQ